MFIEDSKDIGDLRERPAQPLYNAIFAVAKFRCALVENNIHQSYPDMDAKIIARGLSADVTVRNNISPPVENYAEDGKPKTNFKEQGNQSNQSGQT